MKKEDKIEITLQEYKKLLEIKGKYEELKNRPVEIRYIYVHDQIPRITYIDMPPKITC